MGYSRSKLLASKEDRRIRSYDLESLNGKTIGVYEPAAERYAANFCDRLVNIQLSDRDLEYIRQKRTVIVGHCGGRTGIRYAVRTQKVISNSGLVSEVLDEISSFTGLEGQQLPSEIPAAEVIACPDMTQALLAVNSGTAASTVFPAD